MTLIDYFRKTSIDQLFEIKSFKDVWDSNWQSEFAKLVGKNPSVDSIIDLSDHFRDIFFSTQAGSKRSDKGAQASVNIAGEVWEALVCYYINLCCVGSRIVAFKKHSLVPSPIKNALTVNYNNNPTNTESDITVVIFPDNDDFTKDITTRVFNINGSVHSIYYQKNIIVSRVMKLVDLLAKRDFKEFGVGVIQCKTNWNENSQIPMLWDLIYHAKGFRLNRVSVGLNTFDLESLSRGFSYAFATVPTQRDISKYKNSSVQVLRVNNLSGGNYWGLSTKKGIAFSLKEIFNRNYTKGFNTDLRTDLSGELKNLKTDYSYFKLL